MTMFIVTNDNFRFIKRKGVMQTRMISVTTPLVRLSESNETETAEGLMAYTARVSSSKQDNPSFAGLLRYCIKNAHWSVFELVDMTVEIITSRAIAQQILRHRSFCFQEFCVSGDTKTKHQKLV